MADPTQAQPLIASGIEGMCLPDSVKKLAQKAKAEVEAEAAMGEGPGTDKDEIDLEFLPEEFRHTIGGRVYVLRDLKIHQIRQLLKLVARSDVRLTLNIDFTDPAALGKIDPVDILTDLIGQNIANVLNGLGDGLHELFAIILTREDQRLQDKKIMDEAKHFDFELDPDQGAEILSDFFDVGRRMQAKAKARSEARKVRLKALQPKPEAEGETTGSA